jgi:crotonobetainyl-CoA:carnitine CoA-transferase CaiB-like acyl-CoA transferase
MGQPELMLDPRFATNEARVTNQDALDAIVAKWVRPRRRYEVMDLCQQRGIIAAAVQSAEDRVEYDPQLRHRGVHPVIEHPEVGAFKYEGYPVKFSRTPPYLKGRGPMLREHNQYVFGELLGLDQETLDRLAAEEVI